MLHRPVACAVDIHDYDPNMVEMAAQFARAWKTDLDLIYVTVFPEPINTGWPGYTGSPKEMVNDHPHFLALRPADPEITVSHYHLAGNPPERLLAFVAEHRPSLLIMGTHGRKGLARLLGSCATTVLRHATCPVMVYRQPAPATPSEAEPD